jgi:hypothetical protein
VPRRRSLASLLFRTARRVDDLEALASGNPKRVERRIKNKVGRVLGPRWFLALALEVAHLFRDQALARELAGRTPSEGGAMGCD